MSATSISLLFLLLVAASALLETWLSTRQIRHVRAHRAAVPAAFADDLTLEEHQKAADYTVARSRLGQLSTVLDVAWLLILTVGGVLDAVLHLAAGWTANPLWQAVITLASVSVISALLHLPLGIYRVFGVEQRFGFNRQTWQSFLGDLVKGALLGAALGLPLLTGALWLLEHMGRYWWLYVWGAWVAFNLVMLVLYPLVIAPLFNRFVPLEDASLKARIESLLTRCGFTARGVFIMDGSRRSSHGNAYFTGLGRAKRIVFFDTLIERLTPTEIEAVLAHELGHFRHRHVTKRIVWMFAMALAALGVAAWAIDYPAFYQGLGVTLQNRGVGLFLFLTVAPLITLPLAPLLSHYSRRHEYEADAFAAQHADAAELVHGLKKLYRDNASTLTPDPLHSMFYDSHPPAALRIAALQAAQN